MVKAGGVTTTEPFLTRQELADRLQLCVTTVDAMVADGCPSYTWGRRTRRFLLSEVLAWDPTEERAA